MDPWFQALLAHRELSDEAVRALSTDGFVVVPGPVSGEGLRRLADLYDQEVSEAAPEDVKIGSTTTRVDDFVNRARQFDQLYLFPPILEAACRVIQQPFKLSALFARTLRPKSAAQSMHVDFESDSDGWPMLGFIYMIDEFTIENGATCFVPNSQGLVGPPISVIAVPANGPAGSIVLYNGSVWHGHGSNKTNRARRSIQGAYIRRSQRSGGNLSNRMLPQTMEGIGPLARYLLAL